MLGIGKEAESLKLIKKVLTNSEILSVISEYILFDFSMSKHNLEKTEKRFFEWVKTINKDQYSQEEREEIYKFAKDYYSGYLEIWGTYSEVDTDYPNFEHYLIAMVSSDLMILDVFKELKKN